MSNDYRLPIIELIPWLDRELMLRVLRAEAVIQGIRPPAFGDGTLPIAPAFFPIVHPDPNDSLLAPVGIWIRDPRSLDGALATYYIEDGWSRFHGRSGLRVALEMLQAVASIHRDNRAALELAALLFPDATTAERAVLVDTIAADEYDPDENELPLETWPVIAPYVGRDNAVAPAGSEGWASAANGLAVTDPPARFAESISRGDVLSAWAAIGSSPWTTKQVFEAWETITPLIDPRLCALIDQKFAVFPLDHGL